MGKRFVVAGASAVVSLGLAWLAWPHLPHRAREGATVTLVDNTDTLDALLDRRARTAGERPRPFEDGSYPPPLVREPIDEETARTLFPSLSSDLWVYDPLLYARRVEGFQGFRVFAEHPRGGFHLFYNAQGMRESRNVLERHPALRVLVAGDSHTEGVCATHESFANVLEGMLEAQQIDAEVLNAGAGGYHLYNYLGTLERYADLRPDAFVVCVYGGNDFWGTLNLHRYFERQPHVAQEPYSIKDLMKKGPRFTAPIAQELSQVMCFLNNPGHVDIAVDVAASVSHEIDELARSMGCRLLVLYLPPPLVTQPRHFREEIEELLGELDLDPADLDVSDRIADRWLAYLASAGIPFLDLREVLRGAERAYWKTDLHLNVLGHRLVAEAIAGSGFLDVAAARAATAGASRGPSRVPELSLTQDVSRISLSRGGTVTFSLDAGPGNAGRVYSLVGSLSGEARGGREPSAGVPLPIEPDWVTQTILDSPNTFPYADTQRYLDAKGRGTASLTIPPMRTPAVAQALAGRTLHHAFGLPHADGGFDFVSNAVALELVP